jgi:hypothetical protein
MKEKMQELREKHESAAAAEDAKSQVVEDAGTEARREANEQQGAKATEKGANEKKRLLGDAEGAVDERKCHKPEEVPEVEGEAVVLKEVREQKKRDREECSEQQVVEE